MAANVKEDERIAKLVSTTAADSVVRALQEYNQKKTSPTILLGIVVGAFMSLGGFILAYLGVTGSIQVVLNAGSLSSKLTNACPGAVLMLMGMTVLWRYRPKTEMKVRIDPLEIEITKKVVQQKGRSPRKKTTKRVLNEKKASVQDNDLVEYLKRYEGAGMDVSMKSSAAGQVHP